MLKKLGRQKYWLVLALFMAGFLGRTLYYYRGVYIAPHVPTTAPETVNVELQSTGQTRLEPGSLSGIVLVDQAHKNSFSADELAVLLGRVTAAGGEVQYLENTSLEEALQGAKAFVVAVSGQDYSPEDSLAVETFVRNGGRLLLIGDPTRMFDANPLNSLAGRFGILYQGDYVYNLVENDGSYLNVFLRDFSNDPLAEGVKEIVVRGAGSLRTSGKVLLAGDANTYSSLRETPGGVVAMALAGEGNVLALTDLTFLTAPYDTFSDNDRFIDNLTVFLLSGTRLHQLLDFPYLFTGRVDLVYSDGQLFEQTLDESVRLRQMLKRTGAEVVLANAWTATQGTVVIGLYDQADQRALSALEADGIDLSTGTAKMSGIGEFPIANTTLFHLHTNSAGVSQVFILADSLQSLKNGLGFLLDGRLGDCALSGQTALCVGKPPATATPSPSEGATTSPQGSMTPEGSSTPSATPTPEGTSTPTVTPTPTR